MMGFKTVSHTKTNAANFPIQRLKCHHSREITINTISTDDNYTNKGHGPVHLVY